MYSSMASCQLLVALRRPGRFGNEIEMMPPNPAERLSLFRSLFKNSGAIIDEQDLQQVSLNAHGFVAADIVGLVKDVLMRLILFFGG